MKKGGSKKIFGKIFYSKTQIVDVTKELIEEQLMQEVDKDRRLYNPSVHKKRELAILTFLIGVFDVNSEYSRLVTLSLPPSEPVKACRLTAVYISAVVGR